MQRRNPDIVSLVPKASFRHLSDVPLTNAEKNRILQPNSDYLLFITLSRVFAQMSPDATAVPYRGILELVLFSDDGLSIEDEVSDWNEIQIINGESAEPVVFEIKTPTLDVLKRNKADHSFLELQIQRNNFQIGKSHLMKIRYSVGKT